jgi:hypothetical protein
MSNEKAEELVEGLREWMAGKDTDNEKLVRPIADELVSIESDVEDTYKATHVQLASTADEIEEQSKLVDIERTTDSVELLRSKTLVGFAMNTSQGTVPQVINEMATLLNINPEDIEYDSVDTENGLSQYWVPSSSLDGSITDQDLTQIFNDFVAAGYRIDILVRNSFEYRTVTEYNNNTAEDSDKGYNGLDGSGNITTTGGKYTTLVN